MKRRRLWKTYMVEDWNTLRQLQSAWQSSRMAFPMGKELHVARGILETNLSLRDVRDLARHAQVTLPSQYVSDVERTIDADDGDGMVFTNRRDRWPGSLG